MKNCTFCGKECEKEFCSSDCRDDYEDGIRELAKIFTEEYKSPIIVSKEEKEHSLC